MLQLEYLKKREKKSTLEKIYQDLTQSIVNGALFPGYRITEQQICDKYKCSRTPVREVLRRLQNTGLIKMEKNKGATIIGFTKSTFSDLIEERIALENLALKLSISRIQQEEMELLDKTFNFLSFYYQQRDFAKLARIIKGLYQIIYYSTYNPRLENQLLFLYECSNKDELNYRFYETYIDHIYPYYAVIFDCYQDKNVFKAQNALDKINELYGEFAGIR